MMTTILSSVIVTVLIGALYLAIVKSDERMKVIIDTDGGADDAAAIMLLLSREYDPINILAITITSGNTDVVNATKNVLITLETVGKKNKIPVYIGVDSPLMVKSGTLKGTKFYNGRDGFGDVDMKRPSIENLSKKPAVTSIIDAVRENPGEVTLICLGPLTNIAMAFKMYNNLFKELKEMYIVGGSIEGKGNIGTPPTWIEFNFEHDAEAAEVVFINSADVSNKIYLLPWEPSMNTNVSMKWRRNELGSVNRATIKLLNIIDRSVQAGKDEYWIDTDSMLASIFRVKDKYSLITESSNTDITVTTCPKELYGSTVLNARKTLNIIAIKKINAEIYQNILLKYL